MKVLAIEMSSPRGSVSLSEDGVGRARREWTDGGRCGGRAAAAVRDVLQEAGVSMDHIDLWVAGRGPGNYSGIRMALILARSLALPHGKEAVAVDSGAALADALLEETGAETVRVVGDARRNQLWTGLFSRKDPERIPCGGWRLVDPVHLESVDRAEIAATSDWDRVSALVDLSDDRLARTWIRESRSPDAFHLARLALQQQSGRRRPDPFSPLYLHPAVR
ncbi:MAG: tRNA (adenosine(37)-N6)-threonylcarbamoyltransferase complex dimerization subunit type 1 TsaB [Kiritimatiellia bacterium]|nr:tRNA (adenosine(37)-N6)-threonylcarbamoyltransferase complex dimerization subunit type 1 TsaB [Kiritimatiellia bacterium]